MLLFYAVSQSSVFDLGLSISATTATELLGLLSAESGRAQRIAVLVSPSSAASVFGGYSKEMAM
jgi:hypothetical protein